MFLDILMSKMAVFRPPNQTPGLTHCKCDSPHQNLVICDPLAKYNNPFIQHLFASIRV